MIDKPRRRLWDRISGAAPTFIAVECRITGDVETDGAVVLCGTIVGDGRIGTILRMPRGSVWRGEVHASDALIAGSIEGRLLIAGKLEIGAAAMLRGPVRAGSIAIAKGAVVEGEMQVTGAGPIVHFEEKRSS